MQKTDKERVVAELTERLRTADTLIVADYRGLTNKQLEALRARLVEHGARLSVVKNTLTRRAAEAAGADSLLALLEGPTAIAFIEAEGDLAAVAKALADAARETRVLALRGGVLQGRALTEADVDELAKLPPLDVLKGQVVGVILAPLNQLVGLLNAPLQDLVGLIDARIEQLGDSASAESPEPQGEDEVQAAEAAEPVVPEDAAAVESAEPQGEAESQPADAVDAQTGTTETNEPTALEDSAPAESSPDEEE